MELMGIDVSSWQGKPDWARVKAAGVQYAILRVTEKNGIDTSFANNYRGCRENGIPVGVYKYSYAMSVAEIQREAEGVLEALEVHDYLVDYFVERITNFILKLCLTFLHGQYIISVRARKEVSVCPPKVDRQ